MTTQAGVSGHAPTVLVQPYNPEQSKYAKVWEHAKYREVSPGEQWANLFLQQAKPPHNSDAIDFGCGTGRGALQMALFGGLNVTMLDFASNCLDEDIVPMLETQSHALRFVQADITKPLPASAPYGFCTDVMEHIPPKDVDQVLDNCLMACQHVFFQISTVDDVCGKIIGFPLHLSVHPYEWWLDKFKERDCVVHWAKNCGDSCMFYVSAWQTAKDVSATGQLNTEDEIIRNNIRANITGDWQVIEPHDTNSIEVMLVGGSPSLAGQWDEIKRKRDDGVKLIALNGAYKECIDRGIMPSAMMMVDARPFNARFVDPIIPDCKYFIASQCDPSVFAKCPKERTYIWHTMIDDMKEELDKRYERWYGVPGGSTVMLRAIPLFRMLGFKRFHLFGCDSCLIDDTHHAYEQKENDGAPILNVTVGGRVFKCHAWMVSQAQEFIETIKFLGDEIELEIYGDGLLRHILVTGADMEAEEPTKAA
jgi:hypothetical protein